MRVFRLGFIAAAIFLLGAAGGIVGTRILFPKLAGMPPFSFLAPFARNGGTTIINPTEQVIIDRTEAPQRAFERIAQSVVLVERTDARTPAVASGIILTEDGVVATGASLALRPGDLTVRYQGRRIRAKLIRVEGDLGVALLRVEERGLAFPEFADAIPVASFLIGVRAVAEEDEVFVEALVTHVQRAHDQLFFVALPLDASHRGMIFATLEGRIAGIVVSPSRAGDPLRVVPSASLRALLGNL